MSFVDPDSNLAMIRHGCKTGFAAVLAYGIAQLFHLEFGYWAALSAVIVMQVNVADSIRMCLYRFSGTAVGAVIGMVAILIFPETPVMIMLALFCSAGFCAYMTRYNVRYRMAAITVCIVLLASLGQENRLVFGMFRVIEISVGVAAAFVVSVLLWPVRAGNALKARLRDRFNDCARNYDALMEAFLSLQVEVDPHLLDRLQSDILEDRILYQKVLHHERWMYGEDTDLLGLKVRTLEKCCAHLQTMHHALNSEHGKGYEILMKSELHDLATITIDGMRRINAGQIPQMDQLALVLEKAESKLLELREGGATRRFHLQKLVQFFSFYHGVQSMGQDIFLYGQDPLFTSSEPLTGETSP
ncbi:MAG: FUSC family protein [Desulfoplanes sp.]|nr:FUSC family protein [Desulfoplanes sp.]